MLHFCVWKLRVDKILALQHTNEPRSHGQKLLLLISDIQEALEVAVVLLQRIRSGTHLAYLDNPALPACQRRTPLGSSCSWHDRFGPRSLMTVLKVWLQSSSL